MSHLFRFVAAIKEDVNNEESMIIDGYGRFLNIIFKLVFWLGTPYLFYLMLQFGRQL
ncbi:hypothetical protein BGM26_08025 [Bacillus sp. FJAT-29790]|uniref:hypothetical protein n=1 Tax=Bacillus sp. FJAT-29790 TaxID=1895002 RepID=UPI001C22BE5E|nr:hypothetical protein [Bacillus sp. FJAT-29790]MBU8878931.1 hypothetical protein [Bacillus sp. FJAT-29790]